MTHPTESTHVLMRAVLEVVGAKRVSQATGYALGTVYAWARDPMDAHPDGTGQANPLDRLEQIAEALATRGDRGRAALMQLDGWWGSLMDRLLDGRAERMTPAAVLVALAKVASETGDVLRVDPQSPDRDKALREIAEAKAALDSLERLITNAAAAPRMVA